MEKDHIPIIPVPVATTQVNAANQNTRVLMNPAVKNTYSNGVIQQNIQQGINQSLQRHNNAVMENIVTIPGRKPTAPVTAQPTAPTPTQPTAHAASSQQQQKATKSSSYTPPSPNSEIKTEKQSDEINKAQKEEYEMNNEKAKWNFRENKLVVIVFAIIIIILIAVIAYMIYRYDPVKFNYMKPPFLAAAIPPLKPPQKLETSTEKDEVPTHSDIVENATASDIEMLKKLAANNSSKITNLDYDEFLKNQEVQNTDDNSNQNENEETRNDSNNIEIEEVHNDVSEEIHENSEENNVSDEQPKKSIHDWGDDLDSIIDEADKKSSKKQVKEKEKTKKKYQTKKSKKEDELIHNESELIKAEPKHDDFFDLIME
jgi:hypothetical protein